MRLKFYILSEHGTSLFLAQRLAAEGHSVRFYVKEPAYRFRGRGIVDTTRDSEPRRGEIVIIDEDGHAPAAAVWRRRGFSVFGGNAAESWETDRAAGTAMMRKCGLAVPETYTFTEFAAARRFLESSHNDGEWFFKPDDAPSYMTRNFKTVAMLRRFLDFTEAHEKRVKRFELQRKVAGTEVDLDVWVDGSKIVLPHEIDFEEKYAHAGNIGPRTGCQSNLLWDCEDAIIEQTIGCFEDALVDSGYVGVAALNCIVDATGRPHGLEFSNRFGYDSTQAWLARLSPGRVGEQLADFCAGYLDAWETMPDKPFAMTLKLSVPPAPLDDAEKAHEYRGLPLDDSLLTDENFYAEDVMRNGAGELVFAGTEGNLGCLAAVGHSLPLLRTDLLERAASLDIDDLQYRDDPVVTAEKRIDALVRLGLLERRPKRPSAIDFVDERRDADDKRRRTGDDDGGSNTQSLPDGIGGGAEDLNEGGHSGDGSISSGPVDNASPASGDGTAATP